MKIRPLEDRVFVLQDESKDTTEGGLIIPENARHKPSTGIIVKVGPGKPGKDSPIGYLLNDVFHQSLNGKTINITDRVVPVFSMPLKEGDHIAYSHYAGHEIEHEGKKYIAMRFTDVIALM